MVIPKPQLFKNYKLFNLPVLRDFSVNVQRLPLVSRALARVSYEILPVAARTRSRKSLYPEFLIITRPHGREFKGKSEAKKAKLDHSSMVSIPQELLTPETADLTTPRQSLKIKQEVIDMIDEVLTSCADANGISAGESSGGTNRFNLETQTETRLMVVGNDFAMRTPGSNLKSILKETGSAKKGRKERISFAKGDALEHIRYIEPKKRRRASM